MELNYVFVTFPCVILGQVWFLIVSLPDLCPLSYFRISDKVIFKLAQLQRQEISLVACLDMILSIKQITKVLTYCAYAHAGLHL